MTPLPPKPSPSLRQNPHAVSNHPLHSKDTPHPASGHLLPIRCGEGKSDGQGESPTGEESLGRFLPNPKLKLREQLAEVCRFLHLSHRTENAYWHWMKGFILFHGKRHPRDMGAGEVQAQLSHLAVKQNVAVATQRQALNAIVFLYRDVLGMELGLIGEIEKPQRPAKLPTVLTMEEVRRVLDLVSPEHQLACRLLYGTGMRLMVA